MPRPTGMCGRTPSRTARRPTTGCRSSAARPGSGTPAASNIILHNFLSEQPDLNFHNRQVQDALLDVTRFWLERGVDGFRLDTINFYFHSQGLEDNPALPPSESATTRPRRRSIRTTTRTISTTRAGRKTSTSCDRFRALLDEYPAAAAVGEVGDSQRGLEVVAAYTAGGDRVQMCYAFDFLAPEKISAAKVRAGPRRFRPGRHRRLVMLGLLQPRRDAPRLALGRRRGRPDRLSQGDLGAADVAARLRLHLSGRGARPYAKPSLPSRICRILTASASGRNSRAATAAARRWCGRRPRRMAASRRQSRGCRCRGSTCRSRLTGSRATELDAGALPPLPRLSAELIRLSPRARSSSSRSTATRSPSPAATATRRSSAPSISGRSRQPSTLGHGRTVHALDGHGFSGTLDGGTIRLGSYRSLVRAPGLTAPRKLNGGKHGRPHPQGYQEGLWQPVHSSRHRSRHKVGRVHRVRRSVRLRQVDAAAHDRRARGDHLRQR